MNSQNKQKIKVFFAASDNFAIPILEKLADSRQIEILALITQKAKPAGRNRQLASPAIKKLAEMKKIKIYQPEKISEIGNKITTAKPDLIIVAAFGQIIPTKILTIPRFGVINIHPSLLPKYRGASPIQSAILAGEKITGVSIMLMDEKMDTGPILVQKKIKILADDNYLKLSDKLAKISAEMISRVIIDFDKGKIVPKKQSAKNVSYCQKINKNDGKINWNDRTEEIYNQIRAYNPWPSSYCFWHGRRLKIIDVRISNQKISAGKIEKIGNKILIGCADKSLEILKLQLEGKKPMKIKDFILGYRDFIGSKLE